jgi:hypothetical protein
VIRHQFLAHLHGLTAPRSYLEIGINDGRSLALSRTRSIGVDPAFKINVELECDLQLVKATSDDFFARGEPIAWFPEGVVDLALIDGLHLFEFALRDFINIERLAHPGSVVVFDDVLPRTTDEAARDRHTRIWAGDVFKVALALERYRPDLVTVAIDSVPTGMLLVVGLDPASTVLHDNYDDVLAAFAQDDPQVVPAEIMNRSQAADPDQVVASADLQQLRDHQGPVPDFADLRSLRGTASYLPVPYINPPWRPRVAGKQTTSVQAEPSPTIVRRLRRAARAFLG